MKSCPSTTNIASIFFEEYYLRFIVTIESLSFIPLFLPSLFSHLKIETMPKNSKDPSVATMDPRFYEVFFQYFEETECPSLKDFCARNHEFVVVNTTSSDIKGLWNKRFKSAAKIFSTEKPFTNDQPDWNQYIQEKLKRVLKQAVFDEAESTRASSKSSHVSSSNGSSKTKSSPLNESQIEAFKKSFDSMDPQKKWKISEGVVVEDKMYKFGLSCTYEHPVHSFILDVDDPCWISVFSAKELNIIKASGKASMPPLSDGLKEFFQKFSELSTLIEPSTGDSPNLLPSSYQESFLKRLWSIATDHGFYDPLTHFDEDWAQRSIIEYISAYRWNVIQRLTARGSEMDFVVRIWSQLDKCFDNIAVETFRNRGCIATSVRMNEKRRVTGRDPLVPKSFSTKPDLVLYKEDVEYGCSEVGKNDDGGVGEKEIVETALKCPKTMKDMLLRAASKVGNATNKTRQLQIVGFHQTSLRMHLSVLDCPEGYICRLRRSTEYTVPLQPSLIPSQLIPILKLTCKAKEIVRRTIEVLEAPAYVEDEPDFSCNNATSDVIVLPCALCKSVKRKRESSPA